MRWCLSEVLLYRILILFHAIGLHLPPAVKRRGRPKGHDVTVIGLPAKKKKNNNKPVPFLRKHSSEKQRGS